MKRSSLAFLLIILFVIVGCKKGSDDKKILFLFLIWKLLSADRSPIRLHGMA